MTRSALRRRLFLGGAASLFVGCVREEARAAELWIGGDVELGDGGALMTEGLAALVAGATGVVNLEGAVGEAPAEAVGGVRVWNAPGALGELAAAGVRVAGIDNNHAADNGADGIGITRRAVEGAGLLAVGGGSSARVATAVVTAHDLTAGVPARLREELEAVRAGGVLVATFHVTGPPSYLPRPELREAAEVALAAGARVVAAHGTHALGPVERREGAVIAWGLGNLRFDCTCTDEVDGAILRVRLPDDPAERVAACVIPVDAGLRGQAARPSADRELILELFAALGSSPLTPLPWGACF